MDYDNLAKIRARVALYTGRKSSNILDGDFASVYRGRSLDFDDLREYAVGDNIKDIDWKSSSKTGKTLVRRFIAEKKHNVLFVVDSGAKFCADTSAGEDKGALAVDIFGTIAYLVDKHGDDFALMQDTDGGTYFSYFRSGAAHFENLMSMCRGNIDKNGKNGIGGLLDYISENIRRKMVIILITDMAGMESVNDKILRKVTVNNDLLVINIEDAYLFGYDLFDVDRGEYEDEYTSHREKLLRAEKKERKKRYDRHLEDFRRYGVSTITIEKESEIIDRVVELFERHRHANIS
ncbi:MAG: DUF58 domain-containing protein [Eubacterium sp.]|jgi:uncharacterized protein (DUF58 family)|nr:DUF58 domain-containing protein [Eubacterium sp.]